LSITGALTGLPFDPTLNGTLTITFNASSNPLSTAPLDNLTIATFENQSGILYAVDFSQNSGLFTFIPGAINS